MEQSLDDVLNGTPVAEQAEAPAETPPAPAVEATPETPAEATPDRPRDEQGRFLPKGDAEPAAEAAPEASATPAPEDSPTVPRKALLDERQKRQTLEGQLAEMTKRIDALTPQAQPQQPPAMPDQWDDPQGYADYLADQAGNVAEQRAIQAVRRERVMASAEAAKAKYPDYMDAVPVFEELAAQNPALNAQMLQHPNPAEFAYGVVKQHQELSQYGSLEERDAALKAKWEAEALERLKASLPAQTAPPTLSGERNVGTRSGPEWSGPKPLADILQ